MAKDKLVIVESYLGEYQLQWYIAETQDMGAVLGDSCSKTQDPVLLKWALALDRGEVPEEDLEHCAAQVGAASHPYTEMYSGASGTVSGFYWGSKKDVQEALRLAMLRIKEAKKKVPWPQWARDAVAHGWKPPKGWKP